MDNTITLSGTINFIALSAIGGSFLLIFTLQLILFRRQDSMNKNVLVLLKNHEIDMETLDERADILDRAVSQIADKSFNSKMIAKGRRTQEPTFERIRTVLYTKKPENH